MNEKIGDKEVYWIIWKKFSQIRHIEIRLKWDEHQNNLRGFINECKRFHQPHLVLCFLNDWDKSPKFSQSSPPPPPPPFPLTTQFFMIRHTIVVFIYRGQSECLVFFLIIITIVANNLTQIATTIIHKSPLLWKRPRKLERFSGGRKFIRLYK